MCLDILGRSYGDTPKATGWITRLKCFVIVKENHKYYPQSPTYSETYRDDKVHTASCEDSWSVNNSGESKRFLIGYFTFPNLEEAKKYCPYGAYAILRVKVRGLLATGWNYAGVKYRVELYKEMKVPKNWRKQLKNKVNETYRTDRMRR